MTQMAFAEHHALRIEPINRSAYAFCQGEREASGGPECRSIEGGGQISLRMHRRDPGLGIDGFAPSRKHR